MPFAARACPSPDGGALEALGARHGVGGAERGEQGVEMAEVVDFDVEMEGVEAAVAVGEVEVDDIRPLRPQYPGHLAKRAGDIAQDHA